MGLGNTMISTDFAQNPPRTWSHTSTPRCILVFTYNAESYGFYLVFQNPVKTSASGTSAQLTFQGAAELLLAEACTNTESCKASTWAPVTGPAGDLPLGLGQAHSLTREAPDQQLSTRPRVDALLTPAPSTVPAALSLARTPFQQLSSFRLPPRSATYSTDGDWSNLFQLC